MGLASASAERSTRIFVYGTLKRGYTNHVRYLSVAENRGGALFLGCARTAKPWPLVVRPAEMLPATRGPVLMDVEGTGAQIDGELYEIDSRTLEAMDILEGVKSGYYYKKKIAVRCEGGSDDVHCVSYFFPPTPELLALPHLPCYANEHHAVYAPSASPNADILRLCEAEGKVR